MFVWLVPAVAAVSFGATQQSDPVHTITEAEVLAAIGPEHVARWESIADLARAEASTHAARALANPELGVEREAPDEDLVQWTWSLRWQPPLDGRRRLGIQAAEAGREAAVERAERALRELRLQARASFAQWSLAHTRSQVLARSLAAVEPLSRRAEARAEIGEGSPLEARRLGLAVRALEAERAGSVVEASMARAAVEALVPGLVPEASPELPPLPEVPPSEPADLELAALRAELESVALAERLASRLFRAPELTVGWQRLEDGAATFDGPVAAIALGLPLFDRNRGQRVEAEGQRRSLEARIAQRERDVAAGWQAALESYRLLRDQTAAAAGSAGDAERVVTSVAAAFQLGETDVGDLLEALRAARESELLALDLRAGALAALRRLDALLGAAPAGGAASVPPGPAADAAAPISPLE